MSEAELARVLNLEQMSGIVPLIPEADKMD
jgi:hypothetical protein